ncbi:MAG: hypothetical protein RLZZ15_4053 [Verrucomicrobiota bacterium]|jgi:hypothetical protein
MAGFVMAFGITTSIRVMQRGFATLDSARNLTTAGQILSSEMEKLRMYDWTAVSAYAAGPTTLTIDTVFTSSSTVGSRFTLTRTVATISADLLQITYALSWTTYDGRTMSRNMTTYYAQHGIHDYIYNQT